MTGFSSHDPVFQLGHGNQIYLRYDLVDAKIQKQEGQITYYTACKHPPDFLKCTHDRTIIKCL